jgi:hypothetical protein
MGAKRNTYFFSYSTGLADSSVKKTTHCSKSDLPLSGIISRQRPYSVGLDDGVVVQRANMSAIPGAVDFRGG